MTWRKKNGEIALIPLIGTGTAILIAAIGGFFAQTRYTDGQISKVNDQNTAAVQRISTLEADNRNLVLKVDEISKDVKELLKRLK